MEKLNKLFSDSVTQSITNDTISNNVSNGFKKFINKVGLLTVVGGLAISSAGMAHADSNSNNVYAAGVIGGLVVDGMKPDQPVACQNVRGVSGTQLGLGIGVGGLVSNHKALASAVVGGIVLAKEANRIQAECARILENNRQMQMQQGGQYNNNNGDYAYGNNGGSDYSFQGGSRPRQAQNNNYQNNNNQQVNVPRYNDPVNSPTEAILYQAVDQQGRKIFVTASVSPGLRGLMGIERGDYDVNSNPRAKEAIEVSLNKLNSDYAELDRVGKEYLKMTRGVDNNDLFITNYEQARTKTAMKQNTSLGRMEGLLNQLQQKVDAYSVSRGMVVRNLDAAVGAAHLNITQYSNYQQLFNVPESAKITYRELNQGRELPNRYPTDLPAVPMR